VILGGVCVPMGIIGTLTGGYIMKKYNFDIRNSLKYVMVMSSIGCFMITFLFPCGCDVQEIAGLTVPYRFDVFQALHYFHSKQCVQGRNKPFPEPSQS